MKLLILALLVNMSFGIGCKSDKENHSKTETFDKIFANTDDYKGLTVEKLATFSDTTLNLYIQERGIYQKCLPQGISVGKPGRIYEDEFNANSAIRLAFKGLFDALGVSVLTDVVEFAWKGKTFDASPDCSTGTGSNRIAHQNLVTMTNRTFPSKDYLAEKLVGNNGDADVEEAAFRRALAFNIHAADKPPVNLVELNYSDPKKDPGHAAKNFGIRDLMVPILQPDGSGIIYIGRAYAGTWISATEFKSEGLLAWFFLDFSKRARDNE